MTPPLYAQRIFAFSKRSQANSFYSGRHYSALARWLLSPVLSTTVDNDDDDSDFAVLYDLTNRGSEPAISFTNPDHLWNHRSNTSNCTNTNKFLFLRGYPTPKWMNIIGAKYFVDPEFFLRHLGEVTEPRTPDLAILPSLPSSANIIELYITNIGSFNDSSSGSSVQMLRDDCAKSMELHSTQLAKHTGVATCHPIVRKFSVHDKRHFSIEQKISIYISGSGGETTGKSLRTILKYSSASD